MFIFKTWLPFNEYEIDKAKPTLIRSKYPEDTVISIK